MSTNDLVSVRKARLKDAELLAVLGRKAFEQAFGSQNTPENMAMYISSSFSPSIQSAEISDPDCVFLIAEIAANAVAYARLQANSRETCITGSRPIELVRFYVLQDWIGKGIAGILMQTCLEFVKKKGHDVIWLGVWQENKRAIAFYRKWDFYDVGTHDFMLGDDLQVDLVMQRILGQGSGEVPFLYENHT